MNRWIKFSSAACSLLATTLLASPVFAWDFDTPACAPTEEYEANTIPIPQAMLMLDRSLSMQDNNKWEDALDAIDVLTWDMTQSNPDNLRFGLGLFTTDSNTGEDLYIDIEVEAAENTHSNIMNVLNNTNPYGGTPIGSAIQIIKNSQTIQNAPGAAAGILITDGVPNRGSYISEDILRDFAIEAACEHRNVAPLYVVGFGDGTDEDVNDAIAAAGGTGTCQNGGDPCAPGGNQYDAGHWGNGRCEGSIQADNSIALQNALNQLADELACTFDIEALADNPTNPEWDDPLQGCENYDCLKIQLNGTPPGRIFHESSDSSPKGWKWAAPTHTQIRLTGSYCTALRNGDLVNANEPDIDVTRACLCSQPTGNDCADSDMEPAPGTCECPVGTWTCNQGTDVCMPKENCGQPLIGEGETCDNGQFGVCAKTGETVCDGDLNLGCSAQHVDPPEDPEITCDGLDNDCNNVVDDVNWQGDLCNPSTMGPTGPGETSTDDILSRCDAGKASCVEAVPYCDALSEMPEVCNGLDDDCDGVVDNLANSWDNPAFSGMSLDDEFAPAACFEANVCTCPDGPDDIEGTNFQEYLDGWANTTTGEPDPTCVCGSGLSP